MIVQHNKKTKIGLWTCTALVIGNMIGSGIFLLPSSLAHYGGISILGWLFTSLGAIILALLFGHLSRMMPAAGGPYAYTLTAFGEFAAFIVAWGYWIAIWVGNAATAVAFVGYLKVFLPFLANSTYASLTALFAIWLLTCLNISGIRWAGAMQVVTTGLKLIPLLLIATAGWFFVNPSYYVPFNLSNQTPASAITAVAAITLWAFIGLESATVPSAHVEQPKRTIPLATVLGTLITAFIYIASTMAILGLLPAQQLTQSTAPFAEAARCIWGNTGYYIVAAGAVISCFGSLNGWILLQGQVAQAAANDRLFPSIFAKVNKNHVPALGTIVSSILVTVLIGMNFSKGLVEVFNFAILLATLTTLIPYVFCAMAEIIVMARQKQHHPKTKLWGSIAIAILGFLYTLWAIYGAGPTIVFYGAFLLLAGIPIYVWQRWHSIRLAKNNLD